MEKNKQNKNIFWGVMLVLAAVYVVASKMLVLPEIGIMKILMTMFCIALLIDGIRYRNFYQILFPLAFIGCIYDTELGLAELGLTAWTLLLAALLGSIGLTMLFGKKRKYYYSADWENTGSHGKGTDSVHCTGEEIRCENNFGTSIRYINSDNFKNADLENNFGSISVYFDNAIVQSQNARVRVQNSFGETNLYVPKEWQVQEHISRSFGSVSEKGESLGTSATCLTICGETNFGTITIYYV